MILEMGSAVHLYPKARASFYRAIIYLHFLFLLIMFCKNLTGGGGFGAFGNQQGGGVGGGFSAFSSGGTGIGGPSSQLFTQMRK